MTTCDALSDDKLFSAEDSCLYEPSSLLECLELLSRPLQRDHYRMRDMDRLNYVTVEDVITGTGTEQSLSLKKRTDSAVSKVREFVDEISYRNAEAVGLHLLNRLLQIEPESDDEGVPLDESEKYLCDTIGMLITRIGAVSESGKTLGSFMQAFLTDKEQLMYNKYKLMKSVRSASLSLSQDAVNKASCMEGGARATLFKSTTCDSAIALLNNICDSSSLAIRSAAKQLLLNEDSIFINTILINELVETQIQMSQLSKDWNNTALFIEETMELIGDTSEHDVVKSFLRLMLIDRRILMELMDDKETLSGLWRLTNRLMMNKSLPEEVNEIIQTIHSSLDKGDVS
jgi:hypothetical protein